MPRDIRYSVNVMVSFFSYISQKNTKFKRSWGFGIKNSNFLYDSAYISENYIDKHLSSNRPVLICVWNKPQSNRWTQVSHYLVLLATDNQGKWYVSNPNGLEDNSKSSGWYKTDEIVPYIAKILFVEKY